MKTFNNDSVLVSVEADIEANAILFVFREPDGTIYKSVDRLRDLAEPNQPPLQRETYWVTRKVDAYDTVQVEASSLDEALELAMDEPWDCLEGQDDKVILVETRNGTVYEDNRSE